jgi:circadian clock protein KaiB
MKKRLARFSFRIFVAGDAQNSAQAVANLNALCEAHLPGRHDIEVVDVFKSPKRALAERVFMTPTLLKLSPGPARRIVGTLSETDSLLQVLELGTATR